MLKIRRSHDHLIFNVGIPISGKDHLCIETGPCHPYMDYILEVVVIIQFPFTSYIIYFEYTFMAVDGLVTQGAMASVAMIASLLTVPNLCMADASLGAQQHIKILSLICFNLFFSCDQAALRTLQSVCLFVRLCPSVTPFSPCCCHRIIIKFSGVIAIDKSDVHAKGQGQKSKVKVTEVMTPLSRFRIVTPVWIHISLMLLRRGALLFFKVIHQISRSHG